MHDFPKKIQLLSKILINTIFDFDDNKCKGNLVTDQPHCYSR